MLFCDRHYTANNLAKFFAVTTTGLVSSLNPQSVGFEVWDWDYAILPHTRQSMLAHIHNMTPGTLKKGAIYTCTDHLLYEELKMYVQIIVVTPCQSVNFSDLKGVCHRPCSVGTISAQLFACNCKNSSYVSPSQLNPMARERCTIWPTTSSTKVSLVRLSQEGFV